MQVNKKIQYTWNEVKLDRTLFNCNIWQFRNINFYNTLIWGARYARFRTDLLLASAAVVHDLLHNGNPNL